MEYNIETTINSFREYIEFIKSYKANNNEELWFRGHINNQWLLDATLNRNKKMNIPALNQGEVAELKYNDIPDFMIELDLFKSKLKGKVSCDFNDFHYMILGQHYGLSTPALDWTTAPLVGVYFALDMYIYSKDIFPIVFILKPNKLNANAQIVEKGGKAICEPLVIDDISNEIFRKWYSDINNTPFSIVPLVVKSNLIFHRVSRQSGTFTLLDARQILNFPWIQRTVEGEPFGITIKINPEEVEGIRTYLDALNINEETIYGKAHNEWDKLCRDIVEETPLI